MGQQPVVTVDDITQIAFDTRRPGCEKGVMHEDGPVQTFKATPKGAGELWNDGKTAGRVDRSHFFWPRLRDAGQLDQGGVDTVQAIVDARGLSTCGRDTPMIEGEAVTTVMLGADIVDESLCDAVRHVLGRG